VSSIKKLALLTKRIWGDRGSRSTLSKTHEKQQGGSWWPIHQTFLNQLQSFVSQVSAIGGEVLLEAVFFFNGRPPFVIEWCLMEWICEG